MMEFNVESIRSQFPQLKTQVRGKPLVYLDNAATTLIPQAVVDTISQFDSTQVANVHRGAHYLSDEATFHYESARKTIAKFLGAISEEEIVFTKGTTECINLVASSYATLGLKPDDEIILTEMEHHSNLVPWHILRERYGVVIKYIPVTPSGELDLDSFSQLLTEKTKIVSVVYCSNTLGTINPIKQIAESLKDHPAKLLVDAAQSVSVIPNEVQSLGCDYLAFSSHKIFGPFGVGVLWGKKDDLNSLPPYQGGGSMIDEVTLEGTTYLNSPYRFEAGTPNITGAVGLAKSIEWVNSIGLKSIYEYEKSLLKRATEKLSNISGIKLIGTATKKSNILSFVLEGTHPSDVGSLLDQQGIAVRCGHHCTQPLMKKFGVPGTVRASFSVYNTEEEVDRFVTAVEKAKGMLL